MTYDFYAAKEDKVAILKYIFNKTDLSVFDLSSPFGQEISQYNCIDEIVSKFDLAIGRKFAVTFQLWSPRHKGQPLFRKINLDPKHCNGYTFRFATDGWGLIQLRFGGLDNNGLYESHIGHFTAKSALKNESANHFNGKVSDWNWKEIEFTSTSLKSLINDELVARKEGIISVLKAADVLSQQGVALR